MFWIVHCDSRFKMELNSRRGDNFLVWSLGKLHSPYDCLDNNLWYMPRELLIDFWGRYFCITEIKAYLLDYSANVHSQIPQK